ncbi:hypothetical protein M433DRAFT_63938 [Acidomyces richmondensis BFW]|nr:MAG: hypothetical protein FE78DRAFT_69195 [Acidomyces sp. 'richmondensis']KYG47027.1 hypothetical protein M433DRAFT_63938 [Acidomyces richmondensis BFW]
MSLVDEVQGASVELRPTQYLESKRPSGTSASKTALIVLNSPIPDLEYFRRLYNHAYFRVCADGGANRLHDMLVNRLPDARWAEALRSMPPDVIHGDLDSLNEIVQQRYEQLGIEISWDPDQYSTDFGKAVKLVLKRLPEVKEVLITGSLSGRVDQGIGLLHELYREHKLQHSGIRFWLFSEASVSTLLAAGTTSIHTPLAGGLIKRNVGILPLYGPAKISTKGLEWDVSDWPTKMGDQVSTSNHIMADCITISTDHDVLFTIETSFNRSD